MFKLNINEITEFHEKQYQFKQKPTKVFGTSAFPPDGEMGPYPLDGEMGPYPLSDNTNLLSSSGYGMPSYRNYGSNYGTNYASSNIYTAKYSNKKSYANAAPTTNYENNNSAYCNNPTESYETCNRLHCDGGSTTKCNTPVPTRRQCKRDWDSFRRHSAHGRMSSSQGIAMNIYETKKNQFQHDKNK